MSRPLRVLFVAMPSSVHSARWINQVADLGWDLHLFASTPTVPHADFRAITIYGFSGVGSSSVRRCRIRGVWPVRKGTWHAGRTLTALYPHLLARLVRKLRPDLVHSLEIQHAGYLTLAAKRRLADDFPPWIVTNWGSDIAYFGPLPDHAERIREVLTSCDYYTAECRRDVALARQFGFAGEVLGVIPNAGGMDLERVRVLRQPGPSSERRLIVVKGYEGFGLGMTALRAIELAASALTGYTIAIQLPGPNVRREAPRVEERIGIPIEILPRLPHEAMLRLFGRARFAISLSRSDGISTSSLEALALGALPIQSNTSCLDEWIVDGESGLIVPPEDESAVADAIRRAATDDAFVDEAARLNEETARARLDVAVIRPRVISAYERAAARA